ncbi:DNA sulfur modification protein DndD [Streptomyces aidingensis]|uniref:Nuclease SbcCD subunit C n=1 Tax=Streptomyces aidingensis TaxID=910347 RepID=A0A1I1KGG1_9ACTN|nr:DNA sulfur modification protein DndD [Streptomyces aidingensis]SFC60044.1 DNA sulfur modification protein DndD [Streptomyces aidingensis]
MLLRKIVLKDFGAYRGTQTLDLHTHPGKPIVLIGGLNGCGKTTLLDALQLVLYGPRARCSARGNRPYETYLRECINRKADPEEGSSLTLDFSITVEGEKRVYSVTRSWSVSGKSLRERVTVFIDGRWDQVVSAGWADHVEDLLPLEIGSLFFFDGEKIESLADPERASAVIRSAVDSLLGVNTVEQLRTDLQVLQRRKRLSEEDQAVIGQIRQLEARYQQADSEVQAAHGHAGELRVQLDKRLDELKQAEEAFAHEGGELFTQREALRQRRKDAAKHLASTQESLIGLAAGALPLQLLSEQLGAVRKQAAIEQQATESTQVLQTLVGRDQDILDRFGPLLSASDFEALRDYLETDRRQRELTGETERILGLSLDGYAQLAGLEQILANEQQRARELLDLASQQAAEVDALDRQLQGVPTEERIAARQAEQAEALQAVHHAEAVLANAIEAYEASKRRRAAAKAELDAAYERQAAKKFEAEENERINAHCERQRNLLERFKEALLKRHISRLEVAVLESFTRLMRKSGLVRDLRIDTDRGYQLTLTDESGDTVDPGRLSAGERQLLAVSLVWGLARVAGNWLPSVIDTPLGRLDSRHREHLVDRYFPHAGDQVLLLSTDEEIDERLFQRLRPSVAHTYTLVHDDTTFTTTVEPGYWWNSGAEHVA